MKVCSQIQVLFARCLQKAIPTSAGMYYPAAKTQRIRSTKTTRMQTVYSRILNVYKHSGPSIITATYRSMSNMCLPLRCPVWCDMAGGRADGGTASCRKFCPCLERKWAFEATIDCLPHSRKPLFRMVSSTMYLQVMRIARS